MSNTTKAIDRQQKINAKASAVMAMTVDAIEGVNGSKEKIAALSKMVGETAIFEGVDPQFGLQVCGAWTESLQDYFAKHGRMPNPEILANAHQALTNMINESSPTNEQKGAGKAIFEAAATDMRTSDGVMKQATFAAMILPSLLGASTADACTYVPCERDIAEIYELTNIAGSDFGGFKSGDAMNMQSAGAYSRMRRNIVLPKESQPDGKAKSFTFELKTLLGEDTPIVKGQSKIMINRKSGKVDDTDSNIYFNETDVSGNKFSVTGKVDYATGKFTLTFNEVPAAGTEIALQFNINVEAKPSIIPVINQTMRKYELSPSQYVLASEHTVMSASGLQREFGLNLQSLQFQAMTQWLSHEQDMARLRTIAFHTLPAYSRTFDTALPEGQTYESWVGLLRHAINALSSEMVNRTLDVGIRGGFAGGDAANYLRSLPSTVFQPDPTYVQSGYVQYIGKLFGVYNIYEVPNPACASLEADGVTFGTADILFYGRGDGIGKAGLIAGDAVPAMPFVHPTDKSLVNRTTLWGSSLNEIHPRNGEAYFARLSLTNTKVGAYDMLTGKAIEAGK